MNKLQTNINDIKSVAKILKKELANMNFELSHSSALNLASRSLGFKNYQTYKGLFDNSMSSQIKNYPRIHEVLFVKFMSIKEYDIYIYREFLDEEVIYSLLFELKNNFTGRTFFHPKDNTFFIFNTSNNLPYQYPIYQNSIFYYFNMINQLKQKAWITHEVIDDLMQLVQAIEYDSEKLKNIVNKYSTEELERQYQEQKND